MEVNIFFLLMQISLKVACEETYTSTKKTKQHNNVLNTEFHFNTLCTI